MKFRKLPVEIEAVQWNGPADDVLLERFAGHWASIGAEVYITTPEGSMRVSPGDWVIKGVKGEYYPCKPDIFDATYEVTKPAKPHRAVVLDLRVEGDTREALVALLKQMTADIARGQSHCVTGGYDSGGHYQFTLDPDMTHERYVAEIETYPNAGGR